MSLDDIALLNRLRLTIARAAAPDSLRWWDDESLTGAGRTLVSRLFPHAPDLVQQRLAIKSAQARHRVALEHTNRPLHLFGLGDVVELALDDALRHNEVPLPKSITSTADLRKSLTEFGISQYLGPTNRSLRSSLLIELPERISTVELALRFASAYLAGGPDDPVFPYIPASAIDRREL